MKSYINFLGKNKAYTAVCAIGLSISLAFVILIGTYVWQRLSIINENPDKDRVFVYGSPSWIALSFWDKESVDMEIPEVEVSSRLGMSDMCTVSYGEKTLSGKFAMVDPEFFDIFPYYGPSEGSLEAFSGNSGILISRKMANLLSKDGESPVGTTLSCNKGGSSEDLLISGIFEDMDVTLMPDVDFLLNMKNDPNKNGVVPGKYKSIGNCITLIRVVEGADTEALTSKLDDLIHKDYEAFTINAKLYSLKELFFYNGQTYTRTASKNMLIILSIVVALLLASAVFNYVNLTIALSGKRAKEMATRRLLGAQKGDIFLKSTGESIVFTAVCFVAALLLAQLLLPMMNKMMTGSNPNDFIRLTVGFGWKSLLAYVAGIVLLGTVSGMAPAAFSSHFSPIDVVRGSYRLRTKMTFSKVFIVLQNVLAVALIAIAMLMESQLRHMASRPMQSRTENLYRIITGERDVESQRGFTDRLAAIPQVKRVGFGSARPGKIGLSLSLQAYPFSDMGSMLKVLICDSVYFSIMDFAVVEDFGHSLDGSVWFGQEVSTLCGISDTTSIPQLNLNGATWDHAGGILKDFPTGPASEDEINPYLAVSVVATDNLYYAYPLIETTDQSEETKKAILAAYDDFCTEKYGAPRQPEECGFLSDLNKKALSDVTRTVRMMELFMGLSVLLSLLGLIAMSTYFSEQRSKDMAIRKVFGSDIETETRRGVKGYMTLSLLACCIGVPAAVMAGDRYLQQFAYRISGHWWIFALAVAATLFMAFASVVWQVSSVARRNPALELKKE